jgi:hypothetical protein
MVPLRAVGGGLFWLFGDMDGDTVWCPDGGTERWPLPRSHRRRCRFHADRLSYADASADKRDVVGSVQPRRAGQFAEERFRASRRAWRPRVWWVRSPRPGRRSRRLDWGRPCPATDASGVLRWPRRRYCRDDDDGLLGFAAPPHRQVAARRRGREGHRQRPCGDSSETAGRLFMTSMSVEATSITSWSSRRASSCSRARTSATPWPQRGPTLPERPARGRRV